MKVEDVMTKRVVTVVFDDTLETVRELFDGAGFHHLLVVEDRELRGIVSDRRPAARAESIHRQRGRRPSGMSVR